MRQIETKDAVGCVLCHDITQIIRGETKDALYRKGHIVTEEDIPILLSLGKDHIYVWEDSEGFLHENEAAERLLQFCGFEGMRPTNVKEGKIELIAAQSGLFCVDSKRLCRINEIPDIAIACRHGRTPVSEGDRLAGMRVVPLMIAKEKITEAEKIAGQTPLFHILPYQKKKVGIVTTGNEIFYGRITDSFGPVLQEKLSAFPVELLPQVIVPDEREAIRKAIQHFLEQDADLILCTGGMSVDPDDKTPGAIAAAGAVVVSYGAPVLPGSMMMVAYYEKEERFIPILGLPGCVMYAEHTIFDLLLPRFMADDRVKREEIAGLGEGGLCLQCSACHYPNCGFGKGRAL